MTTDSNKAPALGISIGNGYIHACGLDMLRQSASIPAIGVPDKGWRVPSPRSAQFSFHTIPDEQLIAEIGGELNWHLMNLDLLEALLRKLIPAALGMAWQSTPALRVSVALSPDVRAEPHRQQALRELLQRLLPEMGITIAALGMLPSVLAIAAARWFEQSLRHDGDRPHASVRERIGVIDVGYDTTTLALIEAGQIVAEEIIASGMESIVAEICLLVMQHHGLHFTLRMMDEQLIRHPGRGIWLPNGKSLPMPDEATAVLQRGAPEIIAAGQRIWGDPTQLGRVLLGGGGAWAVAPALFKALPRLEIPLSNYLLEHHEPGRRNDASIQNDVRSFRPQWIAARGAAYHAYLDGRIVFDVED